MKNCPNCKAELEDNARFCLSCMTSLEKKEQIQPPTRKKSWWLWVLLGIVAVCSVIFGVMLTLEPSSPQADTTTTQAADSLTTLAPTTTTTGTTATTAGGDESVVTCVVDGVTYTFRPTVSDEHPTAISLENYYTLIRVEGTSDDQIYRVPSFVGDDMSCLVTVVAGGAFDGTGAQAIDLGYNVRYVWGDALGAGTLTDLYLHSDVFIDSAALDNCTDSLTIHCPSYIENTQGELWSQLAADYGFVWKDELV